MRKVRIRFISILLLFSCSNRIIPGKYIYSDNRNIIIIDNHGNYRFSTNGDVHQRYMFSKGVVKLEEKYVKFIPDSSFFFRIDISKYYFDETLEQKRRIILHLPKNVTNEFNFYFNNGSSSVQFDDNNEVSYLPSFVSHDDGSITLKAKLIEKTLTVPMPLHDSIYSNTIQFFDVNANDSTDKVWNVLELNLSINRDMFSFTILPQFILKGKKLIMKDWPVYKLTK